ncbi:MAG: hypothetical protein QNL65_11810 [Opitutales bacterium]|jgi:hypothetical protein|tara:strand:- start:300 stop:560 length:261 start_codon:yes stop_codon:yes gene_type:complete
MRLLLPSFLLYLLVGCFNSVANSDFTYISTPSLTPKPPDYGVPLFRRETRPTKEYKVISHAKSKHWLLSDVVANLKKKQDELERMP